MSYYGYSKAEANKRFIEKSTEDRVRAENCLQLNVEFRKVSGGYEAKIPAPVNETQVFAGEDFIESFDAAINFTLESAQKVTGRKISDGGRNWMAGFSGGDKDFNVYTFFIDFEPKA